MKMHLREEGNRKTDDLYYIPRDIKEERPMFVYTS